MLKTSFDGFERSKEHTPLERLEPLAHSIFTLFNSQRLYQIQQMGFVHAKNPRRSRAIPLRVSKRLSDDVGPSSIHGVAIRKRSIGPLEYQQRGKDRVARACEKGLGIAQRVRPWDHSQVANDSAVGNGHRKRGRIFREAGPQQQSWCPREHLIFSSTPPARGWR